MRIVRAGEAIAAIPDGSNVVFPQACVEPKRLYAAFSADVDRFRALRVYSGFSFGSYSFLETGLGRNFRYVTWQASPSIRRHFSAGRIDFLPARYSEVSRLFAPGGPIRPDVVVTQVSPPDPRGRVSLGISVSLTRDLIRNAGIVIAEVNPEMPATPGDSLVPVDEITFAVEADESLVEYRTPAATARDSKIVDLVLDLIPDGAWVQLGIGSVPDRVLGRLGEKRDVQIFSGMLTQGLVRFLETARHSPRIVTGEIAGDRDLYELCGRTSLIEMATARVTHDVCSLGKLPKFVSVNSAIEIDLHGQVNGETIGNLQVSGVGGSLDYVEAAALSEGGISIFALPSTTEDGKRSKIVSRLGDGAVVTTPRFCVDTVVTEYGVARLRGKSLRDRAEALIGIAHPDFRNTLSEGD